MVRDLTVAEAQESLRANIEDGSTCPCCGQLVRMYRRKLNSNMVRFLISLAWEYAKCGEWIHYSRCAFKGRDYNYLDTAYFGLAEQRPNDDDVTRTSGFWRPTRLGLDFALDRAVVPSHILTYNGRRVDVADTTVRVREALGDAFDYAALMRGEG